MGARTILLLLILLGVGAPGIALAADREKPERPAAERHEAARSESHRTTTPRCDDVCLASELPVYVPPSRSAPPTRLGGGTRGGLQSGHAL